jgi:hypothetical protein
VNGKMLSRYKSKSDAYLTGLYYISDVEEAKA